MLTIEIVVSIVLNFLKKLQANTLTSTTGVIAEYSKHKPQTKVSNEAPSHWLCIFTAKAVIIQAFIHIPTSMVFLL